MIQAERPFPCLLKKTKGGSVYRVEWKGTLAYLAPDKGIRNPGLENPNYNLRNPESHQSSESEIQVLLTRNLESSSWNPESIAWNPKFMTVLDSLTWDDLPFQNLALTLTFVSPQFILFNLPITCPQSLWNLK